MRLSEREINMRLVENLRKAEKRGATAIRRGVERAREEWTDVERRLRQRMRVYPQKSRAMAAAARPAGTPLVDLEEIPDRETNHTERKPIISVHGHDVQE
jgi:hypothetical protein